MRRLTAGAGPFRFTGWAGGRTGAGGRLCTFILVLGLLLYQAENLGVVGPGRGIDGLPLGRWRLGSGVGEGAAAGGEELDLLAAFVAHNDGLRSACVPEDKLAGGEDTGVAPGEDVPRGVHHDLRRLEGLHHC